MARSDLLVSLVRAGASGNRKKLTDTVHAIIAEERAKRHNILAERLTRALDNGNGKRTGFLDVQPSANARDYVLEITPRIRLEDLFLSSSVSGRAANSSRNNTALVFCVRAAWSRVTAYSW